MINSPFRKPALTPPASHPRLMLTKKDLPRVQKNMQSPSCRMSVELWEQLCSTKVACVGGTPDYGTYNLTEYLAVEAKAFRALLTGTREDAREVIEDVLLLLRNSDYEKGIMKARWSGHLIFISAQVYDWCYDYLTAEEKAEIIADCEIMAERYFEMGYPPAKQAAISGHGSEAQLLRDLLGFAIAVYDERPDIYDFCAGRIFDEYVPAYDYMFAGGFHHQGPTYGSYRYTSLLWGALLLYSMSGEKVFTNKLDELAKRFLYLTRSDSEEIRLGDDTYEYKGDYLKKAPFTVPMFFAAAYTGNRKYYEAFDRGLDREFLVHSQSGIDYYVYGAFGEGLFSPVVQMIWNDLTPDDGEGALPPYRYFGSPVGLTIWNDGDRAVLMKMGELWGSNHDHLDTGCFQVYCGGALASDSGVYDSYHTIHRRNYTTRTSAHNCLTVFDPARPKYGEFRDDASYDGGTRRPCGGSEPKLLEDWCEKYKMATVLEHSESEELCRILGDMTDAYSHTCDRVIREMTWEPKRGDYGVLTVRDEVESKSETFITAFHLHCQREPKRIENGVILENDGYELVCRVKTPAQAKIEVIGGEGREFEVDGVNYDTDAKAGTEAGWGQIVITDPNASRYTQFHVEMELRKKENEKK